MKSYPSTPQKIERPVKERFEMKNLNLIQKSLAMVLAIVKLISMVASATAQENKVDSSRSLPSAPSQPQGLTDPAELETFLDELLAKQMEEKHIAGAAVSVVKDGKLFFAKGYGYANVEKGIPVDPEQTIFRTG